MKIALLTFFIGQNYGAQLQAWSLERVLEQQGHQVELVHFYHPWSLTPYWWSWRSYVARTPKAIWMRIKRQWHHQRLRRVFSKMEAFFPKTRIRYGTDTHKLECHPPQADAYVVGSDQVWNMCRDSWRPCRPYLLPFGNATVKRIAYAASLGGTCFEGVEEEAAQLLGMFDAISVREEPGKRAVESVATVSVSVVPDPTIVLGRSGLDVLRKIAPPMPEAREVFYVLGNINPKMLTFLRGLVNTASYSIALQNFRLGRGYDHIPETPQFIDVIARSKWVITNSFHATVMAILYHKPFAYILFDDDRKNERVRQLLTSVGIEGHAIDATFSGDINDIMSQIVDWNRVDDRLNGLSGQGNAWLKRALS